MSVGLDSAVASLMTNKRRVGALKALGIVSVRDALTYYPFRVTEPVPVTSIRGVRLGGRAAFAATVRQLNVVPMSARRGCRVEAVVDDAGMPSTESPAMCRLVFFSHNKGYADWMAHRLRPGSQIVVAGESSEFNGALQFTHPDIVVVRDPDGQVAEMDSVDAALAGVSRPRPVYHASSRISSDHVHDAIVGFLDLLIDQQASQTQRSARRQAGETAADPVEAWGDAALPLLERAIPDILPEQVRERNRLPHRAEAFLEVHRPSSVAGFRRGIHMLRFEEAFVSQTALLGTRRRADGVRAYPCAERDSREPLRRRFAASLPFSLTDGQRRVIDDIGADMSKATPMQRLLQGEVGSGKTVVALMAMLQAVDAGHQAVLVAPTQVLAEQHFVGIRTMLSALDDDDEGNGDDHDDDRVGSVPVLPLTGGMRLARRRRVLARVASGEPCIVVATHAAFSKTFQAPNLALVVIDEQHRFGVEQRETLRRRSDVAPHLLVMTATPIPRTAAMTWFGDLDISWLTELPGGRKPVRTTVVHEADGHTMGLMFAHIRRRIDSGERAYIVCPRISVDDDAADGPFEDAHVGDADGVSHARPAMHAVEEIAPRLSALPQFHGVELATLTGRDDDGTKRRVMADFIAGRTPVLVATTVIEVGVDVPAASCIVVFDADRFGLSQLHQLRGRVGRGGTDSWAFLVSRADPGSVAERRLEVIRGSNDGAEIAQADLELRGAGDVLGDAQSGGRSSLKLLRVVKDADMIADARSQARALLDVDSDLAGAPELAGAVLDFMRGSEGFLTSS